MINKFYIEGFMVNNSYSKTVDVNSGDFHSNSSVTAFVKLPPINIKCFHTEPKNFDTFVDSFEFAVDENDTLPDIQKMNCWKNFIDGKAATLISNFNFKLANENYLIYLNLLKGKLGKLFDTIETQVRNLKYLGNEHDRYGPFLIPVITSKIPDDLNLISSRKFDSADSCVIEIALNALKTKVTAEEKSVLVSKQIENMWDELQSLLNYQEKW